MNKKNKSQRQSLAGAFAAMRPRGNKKQPQPSSPWRGVFETAKPEPIFQAHPNRGGGKMILATKVLLDGDPDPVTGSLPRDADGKIKTKRVPVCLHRCTHINMRHN